MACISEFVTVLNAGTVGDVAQLSLCAAVVKHDILFD
jgi:hypothetical protein